MTSWPAVGPDSIGAATMDAGYSSNSIGSRVWEPRSVETGASGAGQLIDSALGIAARPSATVRAPAEVNSIRLSGPAEIGSVGDS